MPLQPMNDRKSFDVIAVGDLNIDLILQLERLPAFGEEVLAEALSRHAGGVAANFASYCARLGLRVALVARVGQDEFGAFLIQRMNELGVGTDYIRMDETLPTGLTISLSGPQDRAFVTYLGTIDSLTGADIPDELLAQARWLHLGSYFLQRRLQPEVPALFERARRKGVWISLDTGYDPYENWDSGLRDLLPLVDMFLPNEIEITRIMRQDNPLAAARLLATQGVRVALKLGAQGARFFHLQEEIAQPAFSVPVQDTTCCGDAFNAGFIAAWLQGLPPVECLRWGNALGALVAMQAGNAAASVSPQALQQLLASAAQLH